MRGGDVSNDAAVWLTSLFWVALSFLGGALPLAVWIGRLALRRDIRCYGDGNPGATNVFRAGGRGWGVLALVLEMLKGGLPVAWAYHQVELRGWVLVPLILAPVVGHAFSPFLKGRGGKAVAVTGGVWGGLSYGLLPLAGGFTILLARPWVAPDGWLVMLMFVGGLIAGLLLGWGTQLPLWVAFLLNWALLAWTHREDLRVRPHRRIPASTTGR